jgi:hypothetical protein
VARILLGALLLVFTSAAASAQPAADRGYIDGGFDMFVGAANFGDVVHPIEFAEASTISTTYPLKAAPGFDVGGGARVWRRLTVGLAVSRVTRLNDAGVNAQMPHPFFFNQPRTVTGTATGLSRDETAVHLQLRWNAPLASRWQLAVGGGPSLLTVEQVLVQDVQLGQTYPFDTATYAGATTEHVSKSRMGFNVGADAAYLFRPHVGIGGGITFSHARIPLTASASTDAGGGHVDIGLRIRF